MTVVFPNSVVAVEIEEAKEEDTNPPVNDADAK